MNQKSGFVVHAFEQRWPTQQRDIRTSIQIGQAFKPGPGVPVPTMKQFVGLWDTGASGSVISQRIVDDCGLTPITMTNVHTANGAMQAEVYLVCFLLPNKVQFPALRVTKGNIVGIDMLIGMDIIGRGDFVITNAGGTTVFSFRAPSVHSISFNTGAHDFVKPPSNMTIGAAPYKLPSIPFGAKPPSNTTAPAPSSSPPAPTATPTPPKAPKPPQKLNRAQRRAQQRKK